MAYKSNQPNSVCIIIPMYNEEHGADHCTRAVLKAVSKLTAKTQLLIVNDGSTDNTGKILQSLENKFKPLVKIIDHPSNQGYGAALQTGTQKALQLGYEFAVFMDSDLTNDPAFIKKFIEKAKDGCDCVKASRYTKDGKTIGVPLKRRIISQVGNRVASLLFNLGIADCTNGFRMVRLSFLKNTRFQQSGFAIILEELLHLKKTGARVCEIPNTLTPRTNSDSHFSYTPTLLYSYLSYALRAFLFDLKPQKTEVVIKFVVDHLYHPVKSRLIYDFGATFLSLLIILIVFQANGLGASSHIVVMIVFPTLFTLINREFGIYGKYKMAPLAKKILILTLSLATTSVVFVLVGAPQEIVLAALPFMLLLVVLPRWFFNYRTHTLTNSMARNLLASKQPILVVGGGGYIGTHVVEQLLEAGFLVRVLDAFHYDKDVLEGLDSHHHLEIHHGDVSNIYALTQALQDVQAVVHLAGIVGDPASSIDSDLTRHLNIVTTRMLKDSLKAFRVPRFVFASSCSVYGAADSAMTEKSLLNPVSLYAQTKVDSEKEILQDTFDAFHPTILRFATVFGHSRRMRFDLVANLFTAQAFHAGKISVTGGGQWRPFVHVADVATAIVKVLQADTNQISRQILNVGDDNLNITIKDLAHLVAQVVKTDKHGKKVKVIVDQSADDHRNYIVSFKKIQSLLNFHPTYDFKRGIGQIHQKIKSGDYQKHFDDPLYSNLEMTKLIQKQFHSQQYQQSHYTTMAAGPLSTAQT